MNEVQQYLPWLLIGALALLAWFIFRRWSVEYSAKIVRALEAELELPQQTTQKVPPLGPLDIHKQIIRDHVASLSGSAEDKIESLINDFALVKLLRQLEGVYCSIFHSQVVFLRNLNIASGTVELAAAEHFFKELANANPELGKLDFGLWLKYLSDEGLIIVVDNRIGISALGQEFLVWMIRQKKPDKQNGL